MVSSLPVAANYLLYRLYRSVTHNSDINLYLKIYQEMP